MDMTQPDCIAVKSVIAVFERLIMQQRGTCPAQFVCSFLTLRDFCTARQARASRFPVHASQIKLVSIQ